jgi:hypothetical protein
MIPLQIFRDFQKPAQNLRGFGTLFFPFAAGRPAVCLVDPGQQVREGRFSGAGRPHQRQEFPVGDVKGDIVQDWDGEAVPVIGLGEIPDLYNGWFLFG